MPDTKGFLILRLRSAEDAKAWREFVSIYEPFRAEHALEILDRICNDQHRPVDNEVGNLDAGRLHSLMTLA